MIKLSYKSYDKRVLLSSIIFAGLLISQPAVADISENSPNVYLSIFKNAVMLLQFNDIKGHLIGNFRNTFLSKNGTVELEQSAPFKGIANSKTISLQFNNGNIWLGQIEPKFLLFQIPGFIVGKPLSPVVFIVGNAYQYGRLEQSLNKELMANRAKAQKNAEMAENLANIKEKASSYAETITSTYQILINEEKVNAQRPEKLKKRYIHLLNKAKKLIKKQFVLKARPKYYDQTYDIGELAYDVGVAVYDVGDVNYDSNISVTNNKQTLKYVESDFTKLKNTCNSYLSLADVFQETKVSTICNNMPEITKSVNLFTDKVNTIDATLKDYASKYLIEIKKLQQISDSIK